MNADLAMEIEKLERLLSEIGLPFEPGKGATPREISEVENVLGIRFDENLRAMYEFSNGSQAKDWFVVESDGLVTCHFFALDVGKRLIEDLLEMDARGELWREIHIVRDERIQPKIWFHRHWYPFAESEVGTYVYFDGEPTEKGQQGQIVVYQHDPDNVYYSARNFLEFFQESNARLESYVKGELGTELYFNSPF